MITSASSKDLDWPASVSIIIKAFTGFLHNVWKSIKPLDSLVHSTYKGAQWLRGRLLGSRLGSHRFEPHLCHWVVVLEQDTFILAQYRPCLTESCWWDVKNQIKQKKITAFICTCLVYKDNPFLKLLYFQDNEKCNYWQHNNHLKVD